MATIDRALAPVLPFTAKARRVEVFACALEAAAAAHGLRFKHIRRRHPTQAGVFNTRLALPHTRAERKIARWLWEQARDGVYGWGPLATRYFLALGESLARDPDERPVIVRDADLEAAA